MSPISSATGMNSPGPTRPRSGEYQRASASNATIRPSRRSTIGSKTTPISSCSSPRWSSTANSCRRRTRACISGAYRAVRCFPDCFAEYIATSAFRSSSSAVIPGLESAIPMLELSRVSRPCSMIGRWIDSSMQVATSSAPCPSVDSSSTANSSPASRAAVSTWRTDRWTRRPISTSTSSPTA